MGSTARPTATPTRRRTGRAGGGSPALPFSTGVARAHRPDPLARVPDPGPPPAADDVRVERLPLPPAAGGGALSRYRPAPDGRALPFEWTLNPYRGCEFACGYCYARYTHGFLGLDDPVAFEKRIFVKDDLAPALARDLDRRVAPGHRIALGTATDPYQPAERVHQVTRACLQVMARRAAGGRPLRLSITTKSDLVLRDLDLLRVLARHGSLHVNVSITTLDRRLARLLEPRAPTPERRLRVVRVLAAEGIETGVFLMPVLPGLTDDPGALEHVVARAAECGARYLVHQVAFLREPTRSFWLDRVGRDFPALLERYRRWYAGGAHADGDLRAAVARRVSRSRRRHGLAESPTDAAPPDPQLLLGFAATPVAASHVEV